MRQQMNSNNLKKQLIELYIIIYNMGVGSQFLSDSDKRARITAISKIKDTLVTECDEKRASRLTNKYIPATIVVEDVENFLRGTML